MAARCGCPEVVAALAAGGGDVYAMDIEGTTPLHVAARNGNGGAVAQLLQLCAVVDAVGGWDGTPLRCAAIDGSKEVACLLVAANAPLELPN